MDKPRNETLTNGLLAAAIIWGLVLIGVCGPKAPKPHPAGASCLRCPGSP